MSTLKKHDIFKGLVTIALLMAFLAMFFPFLGEIALAAVVALAMEPLLGRLVRHRHLQWKYSVAVILCGMFVVLALPISLVLYKTYAYVVHVSETGFQNTEMFQKIVVLRNELSAFVNRVVESVGAEERFDFTAMSEDALNRLANVTTGSLTLIVAYVPVILLSVFVFCAALYYFLAEAHTIRKIFDRQDFLKATDTSKLINILQRSSYNTVFTSVVVGCVQAVIVSSGALIFHAGDFFVVFVVTFFTSFVPVIGAAPVALVMALYKLVVASYGAALGLGIVAVFAGSIDNIMRPYLISAGEEDLHPVVSLLAIIGAIIVFGMPGLFLGPVIASSTIKIIPLFYGASKDSK